MGRAFGKSRTRTVFKSLSTWEEAFTDRVVHLATYTVCFWSKKKKKNTGIKKQPLSKIKYWCYNVLYTCVVLYYCWKKQLGCEYEELTLFTKLWKHRVHKQASSLSTRCYMNTVTGNDKCRWQTRNIKAYNCSNHFKTGSKITAQP